MVSRDQRDPLVATVLQKVMKHYKHYNNHSGAYIAGTQNSTGAYIIIMACLQALVNNLHACVAKQLHVHESKLHSLSICLMGYGCSAYNHNQNR